MKNKHLLFLLAAGLVLSLTGCEKEPSDQKGDPKEVSFTVSTDTPETKAHYTGEGTGNAGSLTWERISWDKGDPLLIWSDYAVDRVGGGAHAAHYVVGNPKHVDNSGDYPNQSWSILNDNADLGLIYDDDHSDSDNTYSFWSIYPATAVTGTSPVGGTGNTANQVSFQIHASQEKYGDAVEATITRANTTFKVDSLKPNMNQAVMLAAVEGAAYNSDVELKFYPAFTAFEFELLTEEEELTLKKVVLTSSSNLAGTVTATVKAGTRSDAGSGNVIGKSTYTYAETAKSLTFNFPDGTKLTPETTEGQNTTPAKGVIFTVFALPQDITGMTLEFFDKDGISFAKGELKNNGQPITFAACKKHCIRGIKVKNTWNFKYLTLDIAPLDWVPVESEISSGDGVQATQFNVVGADNLRELKDAAVNASTTMTDSEKEAALAANKAYRQWWVFDAGETVTVTYKIMMPKTGTWNVEVLGDTDSFTVSPTSGTLAGTNASATYITLTITSNATAKKSIYLKTTVTSGGETYNLDSETQLYDMRGYHYFIVNGDVNTTAL